MKKLRKLGTALLLTLVLSLVAFGGQVEPPPCAAPVPGQVDTPPCATASGDLSSSNSSSSGDLSTPMELNSETSFVNFAADLLLNFLPLY